MLGTNIQRSGGSMTSHTWNPPKMGVGGTNLLFGHFLSENCMKIKEIGPGGGTKIRQYNVNNAHGLNIFSLVC